MQSDMDRIAREWAELSPKEKEHYRQCCAENRQQQVEVSKKKSNRAKARDATRTMCKLDATVRFCVATIVALNRYSDECTTSANRTRKLSPFREPRSR